MKKPLKIPKFKNEDQERNFWAKIDLGDYLEPKDLVPVYFPNLKPTPSAISLRMPGFLLSRVKERANAIDMPYQSLIKKYIADGIKRDIAPARKR